MYKHILSNIEHRNSPMPKGPWLMTQKWEDLLFLNFPVSAETMRQQIPERLELDTYEGKAWITVIPFRITDMRMRMLPSFPYIRKFLELNVRTYVKKDGVPGIYFFSLDASKLLPVLGAKLTTLPYYYAKMDMKKKGDWFHYYSKRRSLDNPEFKGQYRPASKPFYPEAGTLNHWLVERYYLWTGVGNILLTGGIHHLPWKVAEAEAHVQQEDYPPFLSHTNEDEKMVYLYASSIRVLFWPFKRAK
ncbi:YqjF family protein [Virgibacillus kimchii]